jgi:hypothetical protein
VLVLFYMSCNFLYFITYHFRLTGRPAFPGTNIHEILMKNKRCDITFPPKYWDKISIEGKDLVHKML